MNILTTNCQKKFIQTSRNRQSLQFTSMVSCRCYAPLRETL